MWQDHFDGLGPTCRYNKNGTPIEQQGMSRLILPVVLRM